MKKIAFFSAWFLVATVFCVVYLKDLGGKKFNPSESPMKVERFTQEQKDLFRIHNEKRKSGGMNLLGMDERLCEYAQKHASNMASKGSLAHSKMSDLQEFSGAGVVGENIAWGQESPEDVVSSWMWSPMHRWNIMGSSYKKAGFGVKEDKNGRKYWCVVFSN